MKKRVSELSPEEFQKTFPIVIKEHNEDYKKWYEEEKGRILSVINPEDIIRINHIGSTAIDGLVAKPMIDILLEIDGACNVSVLLEQLKTIGFGVEICNKADNPFRLLLGKGMTCDGYADRVYLLHIRYLGNWSELYFRDYLIAHPEIADEYGNLKQMILKGIEEGTIERMPNGRPNGYSQAKFSYVDRISELAKKELHEKYKPGK